ncbi:hypothetical protein [Phenylobacterium sp.]|jgi:hypothetical protein|uniref:hypothetical protein n=1 Tax=Phenylobacterium sp. TaxID=1871053 RepID=UPI002F3F4EBF
MENVFAILAVSGLGVVAAIVAAVMSSERIKSKGLGRAIWDDILASDRDLYRG